VSGAMRGVLYLEGREARQRAASTNAARAGFEPEHLYYLKGIAEVAVVAIRLAEKFETIRNARDLLQEQRNPDYDMVGGSEAMQAVDTAIRKAAAADGATVLIIGETGTGKEMVAHRIHELSARVENPFVAINCGAISEPLLQSELFGHAKGSFTGAVEARKGKLRQADGGTVFLDEIGELTMLMQSALLRVLEYRTFEPVGKDQSVQVNVRIVAATNVDLEEAVLQKTFRLDLLHRLNVVVILIPPLRERLEDIPLLAAHFLQKHGTIRRVTGIAGEAMDTMMAYSWPGNVRELENIIQGAIINGESELIRFEDLPKRVTEAKPPAITAAASFKGRGQRASKEAQTAAIHRRVKENGGNKAEAARWLGISKQYLHRLLSEE
jgi:transcriptional regulator with PAS, ATPase and Fis domain